MSTLRDHEHALHFPPVRGGYHVTYRHEEPTDALLKAWFDSGRFAAFYCYSVKYSPWEEENGIAPAVISCGRSSTSP